LHAEKFVLATDCPKGKTAKRNCGTNLCEVIRGSTKGLAYSDHVLNGLTDARKEAVGSVRVNLLVVVGGSWVLKA
jgi:hypothetical protein